MLLVTSSPRSIARSIHALTWNIICFKVLSRVFSLAPRYYVLQHAMLTVLQHFPLSTPLTPPSFTATRIFLFMSTTTSSHTSHFRGYIAKKKMQNVCAKQNKMPSNKHWNEHTGRCYPREKSWGETEGVLTYDSKATGGTRATLPQVLFTVKVRLGVPDSWLPSFC